MTWLSNFCHDYLLLLLPRGAREDLSKMNQTSRGVPFYMLRA